MPIRLLALLVGLFPFVPAHAHTGHGTGFTMLDGFMHPLGGADHLAAMIAIGVWAALAGGRRVWLWPAAFVLAMAIGGIAGKAGLALPFVEQGIATSVFVLGLLIALAVTAPTAIGAVMIAAFAVFHGHAHGTEAPDGGWIAYLSGFMVATALLHAVGIGLGIALQSAAGRIPVRALGAATAAFGLFLLVK